MKDFAFINLKFSVSTVVCFDLELYFHVANIDAICSRTVWYGKNWPMNVYIVSQTNLPEQNNNHEIYNDLVSEFYL